MGVAVLGGLVTTMLLLVAVVPPLYLRWGYIATPDTYAEDLFTSDLLAAAKLQADT
jgi:hypothetical protein